MIEVKFMFNNILAVARLQINLKVVHKNKKSSPQKRRNNNN